MLQYPTVVDKEAELTHRELLSSPAEYRIHSAGCFYRQSCKSGLADTSCAMQRTLSSDQVASGPIESAVPCGGAAVAACAAVCRVLLHAERL